MFTPTHLVLFNGFFACYFLCLSFDDTIVSCTIVEFLYCSMFDSMFLISAASFLFPVWSCLVSVSPDLIVCLISLTGILLALPCVFKSVAFVFATLLHFLMSLRTSIIHVSFGSCNFGNFGLILVLTHAGHFRVGLPSVIHNKLL